MVKRRTLTKIVPAILACFLLFILDAQETTYRIVGYYTSWSIYSRQYFVSDIPAEKLTHINYAFINISDDGRCILGDANADIYYRYPDTPDGLPYYGNIQQLHALRTINPNLTLMMSIGGLTWSDKFSDVALTEQSRERFVSSCVELMRQYDFDGIDVDWEFPVMGLEAGRPEDTVNFTLLLVEFRRQLDIRGEQEGQRFDLSIAAPAIPRFYNNIQLDQIHTHLDWINLMGYGYAGRWSDITNHDARLYPSLDDPNAAIGRDSSTAVQVYLDAGVPAEKIVLGVPFYGRGWIGVSATNNGLYQPFAGLPDTPSGAGFYPFRELVGLQSPPYFRYWDEEANAAWLYNPSEGISISYEDPMTLSTKAEWVKSMGLGGMMFWELAYDTDDHTLTTLIHNALMAE